MHIVIPVSMYIMCMSLPWVWMTVCFKYNEMHLLNLLTAMSDDTLAFVKPMIPQNGDLIVLSQQEVERPIMYNEHRPIRASGCHVPRAHAATLVSDRRHR